jgi:hypothetical protein
MGAKRRPASGFFPAISAEHYFPPSGGIENVVCFLNQAFTKYYDSYLN